jgi:uncharacterized protein YoxC
MESQSRNTGNKKTKVDAPPIPQTADLTLEAVPEEWQDDVDEAMALAMETRGESFPPIQDLLKDVAQILPFLPGPATEQKDNPIQQGKGKGKTIVAEVHSDDTEFLESQLQEYADDSPVTQKAGPSQSALPSKQPYPSKSKQDVYEESFASQHEASELRDDIASLAERLSSMERIVEGIVAERKNLPAHLTRLSTDINQQFTLLNSRLNAAIEAGMPKESLVQMAAEAKDLKTSSSAVIEVVTDNLNETPTGSSQTSQAKVITGKTKKIRLVR